MERWTVIIKGELGTLNETNDVICFQSLIHLTGDEIINVSGEIMFPKPVYDIPKGSCMIVKLKDVSFHDASSNVLASKVVRVSGKNVRSIEFSLNSKKPTESNLDRVTVVTAVVNMGWCKSEDSDDWLEEGDYLSVMRHRIFLNTEEDSYSADINVVCYCKYVSVTGPAEIRGRTVYEEIANFEN